MNRNFTVAMLSTLAISFVPSVYAASNYRVQPIMPEGAVETTITSLSDDGRAVGTLKRCSSSNKKSEDCYYRGFIASGGDNEVEELTPLEGDRSTSALGINQAGKLVVGTSSPDDKTFRPVMWNYKGGDQKALRIPSGKHSAVPFAISNEGYAVGSTSTNTLLSHENAVIWDTNNDKVIELEGIKNNQSAAFAISQEGVTIAGYAQADKLPLRRDVAAYWNKDYKLTRLKDLGGYQSAVLGINKNNVMAGYSSLGQITTESHAVIWQPDGSIQDIGKLEKDLHAAATDINDKGQVVGISSGLLQAAGTKMSVGIGHSAGFIYEEGQMRDLNKLLVADDANWTIIGAFKINEQGQIAAVGYNDKSADLWAVVLTPEG